MSDNNDFSGWCVIEFMGHRRLAGLVSVQEIAGVPFVRVDVPGPDGTAATQFYSPGAVYCVTPTTEETARAFAAGRVPAPVARWELAPPREDDPGDAFKADDDPDPSDDF